MSQQQNKSRKPSTAARLWVSALIERVGIVGAAKRLGLSRLATLNVAHGGHCYSSTLEHVEHALIASRHSDAA